MWTKSQFEYLKNMVEQKGNRFWFFKSLYLCLVKTKRATFNKEFAYISLDNKTISFIDYSGVVRIFHLWVPKIFRQPQIYILLPKTLKLALNLWDYPKILWVPKYTSQKSVGSAEPTEPPLTTPLINTGLNIVFVFVLWCFKAHSVYTVSFEK